MTIIATIGPEGSDAFQAARQYKPTAELLLCKRIPEALTALMEDRAEYALIPVYNTREGEVKDYFRLATQLQGIHWVDNIVLPIHLSLGALSEQPGEIRTIIGRQSAFRQGEEYIDHNFPDATLMAVQDINGAIAEIHQLEKYDTAVIESEALIKANGLELVDREIASHNRTRFAVISKKAAKATGYDATSIITHPLRDRVGMLADILGEFTRRGVNILDLQSENDIKTQKLQIYVEVEGHKDKPVVRDAIHTIANVVIQEDRALQILGSFPRVDMRVKRIRSFGFIGSGAMSTWFAERLEAEGYESLVTGRTTPLRPGKMIEQVDVVMVCVPISVTASTIRSFGPQLREGQAMIILAGESEETIAAAMESTAPGVEVMFVHNLWGPQALTMKDKNATVVRTHRSGAFCSEFEAFMYKHGADICHDSAPKHDLLMGIGQKLPTMVSVALARTLAEHQIDYRDIGSHSTLTSLYGILAMARVHNQNSRTYAEIMATSGEGRKIVRSFARHLNELMALAEDGDIAALGDYIEANRKTMPSSFLEEHMRQAKAVDEVLSQPRRKQL